MTDKESKIKKLLELRAEATREGEHESARAFDAQIEELKNQTREYN